MEAKIENGNFKTVADRQVADLYLINLILNGATREDIMSELDKKFGLTGKSAFHYYENHFITAVERAKKQKIGQVAERNLVLLEVMLSESLLEKNYKQALQILDMQHKLSGAYVNNLQVGNMNSNEPIKISFNN